MKELLTVGVIGTGNCGGQLADAASGMGFKAIAINASQDDMSNLVNPVDWFMVGDGNGTGKSREEAQRFLNERTSLYKDERLINFILTHDICVITTSTGGGFGSGTSLEIIKTLADMYPDKLFIPAGVLPFNAEGFTAQNHSVQWLQDLEDMEISYLLYDNDRFEGRTEQEVCEKVCKDFLTDIRIMRGDFVADTITGGIDPRDLLTVYSTPGRIVSAGLSGVDVDDLSEKSLVKTIKGYIDETSAHADMVDDKQILASATMYCLPDEFDPYKGSVRADVQDLFGSHIGDYANFSDIGKMNADEEPSIAIVLAGLSAPQNRIARLVKRMNKLANDITTRKQSGSKLKGVTTDTPGLKLRSKSFGSTGVRTNANTDHAPGKHVNNSAEEVTKKTKNNK